MKKLLLLLLVCLTCNSLFAQITFIGITGNTDSLGSPFFDHYVHVGQNVYVNWEVYANGETSADACGTQTSSWVILRRMADNDSTSVIASAPIIVQGICTGKGTLNGNNDAYYVNLSSAIDKPGRYSVEIQAGYVDHSSLVQGIATIATTWNYMCPPAYYLTGPNGPTGNYYAPYANCSSQAGESDPVGAKFAFPQDSVPQIGAALHYFTVGEAGVYREMLVFNGIYYDMDSGKFQPGNPRIPASLNGINPISTNGICDNSVPALPLGAEINVFKRTDCNADVTGGTVFYSVYKSGTAPAYTSFNLGYKDACPAGNPEGNIFAGGGSCNNINNVLDQRWQTSSAVANILPTSFNTSDTGTWVISFYIQTYIKDCAGNNQTITSELDSTTFTLLDSTAPGSPCSSNTTPVILQSFKANHAGNGILLSWVDDQEINNKGFEIERSTDGKNFTGISWQPGKGNSRTMNTYTYADNNLPVASEVFYRLKIINQDGSFTYSYIVAVNFSAASPLTIQQSGNNLQVHVSGLSKGNYSVQLYAMDGKLITRTSLLVSTDNNTALQSVELAAINLAKDVYVVALRDESGNVVAKTSFVKQ